MGHPARVDVDFRSGAHIIHIWTKVASALVGLILY